jgi:hypothetical protein
MVGGGVSVSVGMGEGSRVAVSVGMTDGSTDTVIVGIEVGSRVGEAIPGNKVLVGRSGSGCTAEPVCAWKDIGVPTGELSPGVEVQAASNTSRAQVGKKRRGMAGLYLR